MKGKSLKFKVQSFLKELPTVYCSPPPPPLSKGGRRGGEKGFTPHHVCSAGFTLIEVIMIIVVVAIAIPALLIILGQGAKQGVDAELMVSATNVAQAMMEEIKSKRWDENATPPPYTTTPFVPEEAWGDVTHPNYDDVDDYHNLYANSVNNDFVSVGGVTYTRDVQVCYVCGIISLPTCPAVDLNTCLTAPTTTDYKRIQVTVSNTTLGSVVLVTVVTNY